MNSVQVKFEGNRVTFDFFTITDATFVFNLKTAVEAIQVEVEEVQVEEVQVEPVEEVQVEEVQVEPVEVQVEEVQVEPVEVQVEEVQVEPVEEIEEFNREKCPFPRCNYTSASLHNLKSHYGGHLKAMHTNNPMLISIDGSDKVRCAHCFANGKNKPITKQAAAYHLATCSPLSPYKKISL